MRLLYLDKCSQSMNCKPYHFVHTYWLLLLADLRSTLLVT